MRSLVPVVFVALLAVFALGAPAHAQSMVGSAPPAGAAAQPTGSEVPKAWESLSQREKEREMQAQQWQGPSGFWTSPHKSEHGAYRYRMMCIGAALLLGMGFVTLRLIRRARRERAARS